jgi:orotate phosphoribosyltransferase
MLAATIRQGVGTMPSQSNTTVAELLVDIGAVGVEDGEPFTFASGLTSPMYCDNRLFLSHPAERKALIDSLCGLIRDKAGTDWDAVAGVASAGIPFAAWVADRFDKPMVYIRPAQKDHGRQRQVEGGLSSGRVVLVEDLITTGGSALHAIAALRDEGLECSRCFSIFDYGFSISARLFEQGGVDHYTLAHFDDLLPVLRAKGKLKVEDLDRVRKWHDRAAAEPART